MKLREYEVKKKMTLADTISTAINDWAPTVILGLIVLFGVIFASKIMKKIESL
jgi:hypothetical protein